MKIRAFCEADAEETLQLFCDTVRSVCLRDYTKAQTEAWVGAPREAKAWAASFEGRIALVALLGAVLGTGYSVRRLVDLQCRSLQIQRKICDGVPQ